MMILDYLLAISLILVSVVKSTDLFILSDKKLSKVQSHFIKQTRSLHHNSKGSVSLVAAVLVTILSAYFLFLLTKMKLEYKEALYRKKSYLCFHFLNTETEKYINEMAYFNWSLRSAFLTKNTINDGVSGEVVFQALKNTRNTRHYLYLKKMASNQYCHLPETLSYLKSLPFLTHFNGSLITQIDETTLPRQHTWSTFIHFFPNGIRSSKAFCLKSTFHIQNEFVPNLQKETSEIATKDLQLLKCSFGYS
jgi:hypothetical protein